MNSIVEHIIGFLKELPERAIYIVVALLVIYAFAYHSPDDKASIIILEYSSWIKYGCLFLFTVFSLPGIVNYVYKRCIIYTLSWVRERRNERKNSHIRRFVADLPIDQRSFLAKFAFGAKLVISVEHRMISTLHEKSLIRVVNPSDITDISVVFEATDIRYANYARYMVTNQTTK